MNVPQVSCWVAFAGEDACVLVVNVDVRASEDCYASGIA